MGTEKRQRQKAGRAQRLEEARIAKQRAERRRLFITIGVFVAIIVVVYGISLVFSNRNKEEASTSNTTPGSSSTTTSVASAPFQYGTGTCPPAEGSPQPVLTFSAAPKQCIDPTKSYTATFEFPGGPVKVQLDTTRTPGTSNNFVVLSRYGYYNGSQIFRTDKSIDIIQGGAPHTNSATDPGPGYTIPDEGGKFTYQPGQLVMARSQGPNSGGAQFFFTVGPNASNLDNGQGGGTYVVFGTVTEGLDILQKVLAMNVDQPGGLGGAPGIPVAVTKVTIEESAAPAVPASSAPASSAPASSAPASSAPVASAPPGT